MPTRLYFRNTQTNPGTGGTVYDLNETQGSPQANIYLVVDNNAPFAEVAAFTIPVNGGVNGTTFPVSVNITSVSAGKAVRWRVQRRDSSGVVQASSAYSAQFTTTGTKTETLTLSTTWATGDRLAVSIEGGHVDGHGGGGVDISTQDANAFVDAELIVSIPEYIASGAITSGASTAVGAGTRTIPERTGAGAITSSSAGVAGAGSYVPAPITGNGAVLSDASAVSASAVFAAPTDDRVAYGVVVSSPAVVTGTGIRSPPERTAAGIVTSGSAQVSASGSFASNDRIADGAITSSASVVSGAGEHYDASVHLYAQYMDASGTVALTDQVLVASYDQHTDQYQNFEADFTIQGEPTGEDWNTSELELMWVYASPGKSGQEVRVTKVAVEQSYSLKEENFAYGEVTAGAATVAGTGTLSDTVCYLHVLGNGTLNILGAGNLHYFKGGQWHPFVA